MTDILPDWLDLTEYYFVEPQTSILDRFARLFGLDEYEPPKLPAYRIFDVLNKPILCRLCNENHWTDEEGTWVCDHGRDPEYELVPMAVRDEKLMSEVWHWEAIE